MFLKGSDILESILTPDYSDRIRGGGAGRGKPCVNPRGYLMGPNPPPPDPGALKRNSVPGAGRALAPVAVFTGSWEGLAWQLCAPGSGRSPEEA